MRGLGAPSAGRPKHGHSGRADGARHGRLVAGLAALLTIAILAVGATSASALIVHVGARTLGYEPLPRAPVQAQAEPAGGGKPGKKGPGAGLEYNGGPIMPANTNYALYWDPAGAPEYPAGYETGLDTFFEQLAHDSGGLQNTDSVLTQYGDEAGEFANYNSHFGGALIDTDPYPANGCTSAPICFTDEQLRAEITAYVEAHKLPMDLKHEYFLLTPPGVESCLEATGRRVLGRSQTCHLLLLPQLHPGRQHRHHLREQPVCGRPELRRRRRTPERKCLRCDARRRARPRAQRVTDRSRAHRLAHQQGRRGRRQMPHAQSRRANSANRSARRPTAPTTTR